MAFVKTGDKVSVDYLDDKGNEVTKEDLDKLSTAPALEDTEENTTTQEDE